jgi:tetratricopeptide (TPR) repeat protein
LCNIGIGQATAGDWTEAAANYKQALSLAGSLGSQAEQARIENSLGWLATNQGEDEAALVHFTRALELSRSYNLTNNLAYILACLGVLQVRQAHWEVAVVTLQEAERIALETEVKYPLAEIYYSLAQAWLGLKEWAEARSYAEKALDLTREMGLDFEEGIALGVLGRVKLAAGPVEEALVLFEQSVARLEARDPYQAARSKVAWGGYLLAGPDPAGGAALLQAARTVFEKLGARRDLAEVDLTLAKVSHRDWPKAP